MTPSRLSRPLVYLTALLCLSGSPLIASAATKGWETSIDLPTYRVAPPDTAPRFYSGRTYQGAAATFYPYPVSDQMTERRESIPYKALYLENEYLQISVLPELGGRIFTATDKGNGYDFFYRQHVIKPALIGMLGAWISGGVEWNIPHHHRASSFMPVQHAVVEEPDGAKTIWVGETELRHRIRWLVGLTVRPDHSYIEMTVKVFNRTPAAQSFLFWINPAVHANTNYQVIFPPSTQWAVQHGKPEFASWPIARQSYGGVDYSRGVDISWWKNHPSPVSFFAWNCEEDFFGGYDHGKKAGVIQISNHHVSPGKKFFEWGNGSEGDMWSKILSDEDGPYLELMAGSYSDNQPDYSWCQPHEVKVFKHYWYPVRDLGGIRNANSEAALNLDVTDGVARLALNTTAAHKHARVLLQAKGTSLMDQTTAINPNKPFATQVPLPAGIVPNDLKATLVSDTGATLISYQPQVATNTPEPEPVSRPKPPAEITSTEDLLLTGLRVEQLYSPSADATLYYLEALKRDNGDYRANVALGSMYCRQGRFAEAEPLLRKAVERATANYIRPKDCEALYYLGVALRNQGALSEARNTFYRSIWDRAWQAPGYYALAELSALQGHQQEALELADKSIQAGSLNTKALELKVTLLRHAGNAKAAKPLLRDLTAIDPLNARAAAERALLADARMNTALNQTLRGEWPAYLELATDYANGGFYQEAVRVLEALPEDKTPPGGMALAGYYLAYYQHQLGNVLQASAARVKASQFPSDFGFPFQHEAELILRHAIQANPKDSRAPYYLGNLLFDHQPARAISFWEQAVKLDPSHAMAQRNLAIGRSQAQNDLPAAIAALETALSLDPSNPRMYFELDALYESAGESVQKRLASLERHPEATAQRDDATTRRIQLLIAADRAAEAVEILKNRQFHNWEGSSSLHDVHVDACLQAGLVKLQQGRPQDAMSYFRAATEYPANQQVGRPRHEQRVAEIQCLIGRAAEATGDTSAAHDAFERAAASGGYASAADFYRAIALRKLGRPEEAQTLLGKMRDHALAQLNHDRETVDYFAKFGERRAERLRKAESYVLAGLAYKGLGDNAEAAKHFNQALELHPAHVWARTFASTKFD